MKLLEVSLQAGALEKWEATHKDDNDLSSLKGAPAKGNFSCRGNALTSLNGAPVSVHGFFDCADNGLTSLEGAPESVGTYFTCRSNEITSLKGVPKIIGGYFSCSDNNLKTLKDGPTAVEGTYYCAGNQLTSLEGAPSTANGGFVCNDNFLTSLKDIHLQFKFVNNLMEFKSCPIESHVLGLLKINGLDKVHLTRGTSGMSGYNLTIAKKLEKVQEIINKHLKGNRNLFDCQEELEDAGFEEYAKL